MTLFIASLLIYNFNMEWWWYGVAAVIWIVHLLPNPLFQSYLDS